MGYSDGDACKWVESLQCRLRTLRECALSIAEECAGQRSAAFNKHKSLREFSVGEQALLNTPGLIGSLESSWKAPCLVKHKLSRVNYRVTTLDSKTPRIVQINNCNVYTPRSVEASSICVVAEEDLEMAKLKCTVSVDRVM